ncbi:MAG: YbbR-like domain-containing protein [Bacteroidales bacterium]|nr:YbbR-like domain-containing protein [Bacteroidales bacterium]
MRKIKPSFSFQQLVEGIKSKQVLTFVFFLALSTAFWFFQTINEVYKQEFEVPIQLTGVPDHVVITTPPPKSLRITLRDRGGVLLRYRYLHPPLPIVIKWADVSTSNGLVSLSSAELLKPTLAALEGSTAVSGIRPETIDIYFNYGLRRELPVVFQGQLLTDSAYTLMAVDIKPRVVNVYASRRVLDTLAAAYLEPLRLRQLKDTTVVECAFVKIPGVKYVPERVKMTIMADRLVEKTVEVPIQGVNFPAGKTLRTFPAKATVRFLVGMSQYKRITPDRFVIALKYEDLLHDTDRLFPISSSQPEGVRRVRVEPSEVEYVIEETPSLPDGEEGE